ncbi:MAG: PilZ domain-containing protein [Candidatus Zapsychrus exili]|nr:PilZ domain-containing protein [Candidatus Zapsychrus exili]
MIYKSGKKGQEMTSMNEEKTYEQNNSDGRYLPRWEVDNRVLYRLEDEEEIHEGHTKDLSCSGACLRADGSHPSSPQKIKMTIYLSDEVAVRVEGEVRWSKQANGEDQLGVIFSNTSSKTQGLILDHAFELKPEDLENHWYKGWK